MRLFIFICRVNCFRNWCVVTLATTLTGSICWDSVMHDGYQIRNWNINAYWAGFCRQSDRLVILLHSTALWFSPQYTQRRCLLSSRRAWYILVGRGFCLAGCSCLLHVVSTGFLLVHSRIASESFEKCDISQPGTVRTRTPRIAGNLSSVIDTAPLTCSSLLIVCRACTQ